jgi:RND family efflux transporter MFP subunit
MTRLSLAGLALLAATAAFAAEPSEGVEAVTRPSADITLKFTQPGLLAEVKVKDGDRVSADDVLARLDDEVERLQVAKLKAAAEDRVHVDAAEAQVAQRKADLKKLEWAGQEGAATQWEIDHARLDVVIGELSVRKAEFDLKQAELDWRLAEATLKRMKLSTPVDGIVHRVFFEEGEAVQALEEVIRVVAIDPLWVDVPVPLPVARGLKLGDPATVAFPDPRGEAVAGKVIHVSVVADAAANTLTVRVEVPNASSRPAGERVRVGFGRAAAPAP